MGVFALLLFRSGIFFAYSAFLWVFWRKSASLLGVFLWKLHLAEGDLQTECFSGGVFFLTKKPWMGLSGFKTTIYQGWVFIEKYPNWNVLWTLFTPGLAKFELFSISFIFFSPVTKQEYRHVHIGVLIHPPYACTQPYHLGRYQATTDSPFAFLGLVSMAKPILAEVGVCKPLKVTVPH